MGRGWDLVESEKFCKFVMRKRISRYKLTILMRKIFTLALALGLCVPAVLARPARPGVVKEIVGPDGRVVEATLQGDEHFHYFATADGRCLLHDGNGGIREVAAETLAELRDERLAERFTGRRAPRYAAASAGGETWRGVGLFDEQFPHDGAPHTLIILVEYEDVKFRVANPAEYFNRFLNEEGFSSDGGTGSCRDYFSSVSMGQFTPTFDVYGPVSIKEMSYYGGNDRWGNDQRPEQMVVDACKALDSEIDFSKYDTNGDGYVDNIYIFYAGQGEADYGSADTVWPHQWELSSAGISLVLDGMRIDKYGCCNEWAKTKPDGIGAFCHEFGHVLGLPDLYNTNSPTTVTPGTWDVMDSGTYNNDSRTPPSYSIFERNAMGWIDLEEIAAGHDYELNDIQLTNEGFVLKTDVDTEFFLFENRQKTGWDAHIPGKGMLVWHINYVESIWRNNRVNNTSSKQYVDIEEACGQANNSMNLIMGGYTFPGRSRITSLSDDTKASLKSWSGKPSGLIVHDIDEADGVISFTVSSAASVGDVIADGDEGPAEIYTLQGVRVSGELAPGIYVRRAGGKVEKIAVSR